MAFVELEPTTGNESLPTDAIYVDVTIGGKVVAHLRRRGRHDAKGIGHWHVTIYDAAMNGMDCGWSNAPLSRVRNKRRALGHEV